jgi:acyl-CoA reductase-like NAD-dependent aldehyde dehydrogenase
MHKAGSLPISAIPELMASAKRGFTVWRDTPYADRRKVLLKANQILQERIPQLIQCESTETTAGAGFAGFDVAVLTTATLEETLATMSTALRGEMAPLDPSGKRMAVIREPYGGVLSIVPWNAPSTLCMRAIVNPIAAGNAVILKTSEFSPKTHSLIAQVFYDAGLPAGVLNVVNVSTQDAPTVVKALIEHEFVRKVNFTGSTRIGRVIAQTCAANLKPVVLELGGKAPVIVTDEADIDLAANNIIFGGFMNQGQICMSTASVLVHKDVAQKLNTALATLMKQNQQLVQAGAKPNSPMSPDVKDHRLRGLFTSASSDRAKSVYDEAVQRGAKLIAGQPGFDTKLGLVQPVLLEATPEMQLYGEELFAPVLGVYTFTTDEQAVDMANAPGAGLSASVYCKDETRAWKIARGIESGAVHINGITVHDSQDVPHGGIKTSGSGRFNGVEGIREYLYQKTITITPGIQYPFFAM